MELLKTKIKNNRKRGNRISALSREARKLSKQTRDYTRSNQELTDDEYMYLSNFSASLNSCCSNALYRIHIENGAIEYLSANSCKHKLCPVCNSERSKLTRRKYINYFEKNKEMVEQYDFMHLTLTVPHKDGTFRNKRIYIDDLIYEFNHMRKKDFWKDAVYAGEFGIEMTKGEDGIHIHIHALLLVIKQTQNRNHLHKEILLHWNKRTIDKGREKRELTDSDKKKIASGNKLIDENQIKQLDTRGSTFISLENLYTISNGKKKYINTKDFNDFIAGLMECIKYHFEPFVMNKADRSYDFDLLRELAPMIKGKQLYRKFGAFHGMAELNINNKTLLADQVEEARETLDETAHGQVYNPITLQPADRDEYEYVIMDTSSVFYLQHEGLKPITGRNVKKKYLHNAFTMMDAILDMINLSILENYKLKYPKMKK